MKKRILALVMTLAMVVTSLSMLSFVTFAEDTAAPAENFYAYRATQNIDAKLGNDEVFVPVNKELRANIEMGMAWDYENVSFVIYHEGTGTGKDGLEGLKLTLGGAVVTATVAGGEFEGPEGTVVKFGGVYDIELSIPLSEIMLDADQLAAGVAAAPMSLEVTIKDNDVSGTKLTKDYNVILSGRSLIKQMDLLNEQNANPNAAGGGSMTGNLMYKRGDGAGYATGIAGFTMKRVLGVDGGWEVKDSSTVAGMYQAMTNTERVVEYTNINDGGKNHIGFEFTINNLPVGEITTNDVFTTFNNTASNIQIHASGAHTSAARGFLGWIYNDAATGLTLAYYNGTGVPSKVDLGVELGEKFTLGINELAGGNNSGTLEILVNEVVVATYTGGLAANSVTSNTGYIYVSYQRGKGTGNHSLDLDGSGAIEDNEKVDFKFSYFTLSKLADVNVAKVASLAKNGTAAPADVIIAKPAADATAKVNVGSLTDAYAYWNKDAKTVTLAVNTANIDVLNIKLGGFETTVSDYKKAFIAGQPETLSPTVTNDSAFSEGAKVTMARPWNYTFVTIPLGEVAMAVNEAGFASAALVIEAVQREQIVNNFVRTPCTAVGTFDGELVFEIDYGMQTTTLNGYQSGGGNNAGITFADGKFTFADSFANSSKLLNGVRAYYIGSTNLFGSFLGNRKISFKLNIATMNSFEFDDAYSQAKVDHGKKATWSNVGTALDYERLCISTTADISGNDTVAGAFVLELVNDTTDGLALVHTDIDGKVTPIVLGDVFGEDVLVEIVWNADNSGEILINGESKATYAADKIATIQAPAGGACYLGSGAGPMNGQVGLNLARSKSEYGEESTYFSGYISEYTSEIEHPRTEPATTVSSMTGVDTFNLNSNNGGTINADKTVLTLKDGFNNGRIYVQGNGGDIKTVMSGVGDREISFDLTVNDMAAYDFATTPYTTDDFAHGHGASIAWGSLAHKFDRLIYAICGTITGTDGINVGGAVALEMIRDTTDGLIIVHCDKAGNITSVKLGDVFGDKLTVKLVWNKDNTGEIWVNGEKKADLACALTVTTDDDASDQQLYFGKGMATGYSGFNFVDQADGENVFDATVENYAINVTVTAFGHTDLVALGAGAPEEIDPDIKLSYVQETSTSAGYQGMASFNLNSNNGGTFNADKTALTFKDNLNGGRVYVQGNGEGIQNVLKYVGDREVTFDLTINDMKAFDFTTTPYTAADFGHGVGGKGNIVASLATKFDRLLYGICGTVTGTDGDSVGGASVIEIVRDTTKGLIIVHCDTTGKLTSVELGDVFGDKLAVKLVWNKDNTGSIWVNGEKKADLANALTSTTTDNTDQNQQLYFGSKMAEGYNGFNFVDQKDGDNVFDAVVENYKVNVTNPEFDVRFIASINTLNAASAGFKVSVKGSEAEATDLNTTVAYKGVLAGNTTLNAAKKDYFIALAVEGVDATADVTFVVVPYIVTVDGTEVLGQAYEVSYAKGVYTSCTAVQ